MPLTNIGQLKSLAQSDELHKLKRRLDEQKQFNIFEALDIYRKELPHSSFLAFLLDPKANHNLGDAFAKAFLNAICSDDITTWDLSNLVVEREWEDIDILLIDQGNNIVVIVENKVFSPESEGQLGKYWRKVEEAYSDWQRIGLFLSPNGTQPTDTNYSSINYQQIADLLVDIVNEMQPNDVRVAIQHYVAVLRRHIVDDPDLDALCRSINHKHKSELDVLFEYRQKRHSAINDLLKTLVTNEDGLCFGNQPQPEGGSGTYTRFAPSEWDVPELEGEINWSPLNRILLFEFVNGHSELFLKLTIGRGFDKTRQTLHVMARTRTPFQTKEPLGAWHQIYKFPLLDSDDYYGLTFQEIEEKIRTKWREFLKHDLPAIREVIRADILLGASSSDVAEQISSTT